MKLQIFHRTRYTYASPVRESFNEARLQPVTGVRQTCHSFELKVQPLTRLSHYPDFYFNCVHQVDVPQSHQELVVEATSQVTTENLPGLPADAVTAPIGDIGPLAQVERCYDFLQPSTYVAVSPEIAQLAVVASAGRTDTWQAAQAIMQYIHREFTYRPATTNSHTHMSEVLQSRIGVCQDFAHVMLGLCRSLKLPARYVSGYLYNGPADQLRGAQASHAWVEVFVRNHGWHGLDPTNAQVTAGRHVKVAVGRDYSDVPPVKGTYRGTGKRTLTVDVLVTRLDKELAATG